MRILIILFLSTLMCTCQPNEAQQEQNGQSLMLYVGAASKPPVEELAAMFEEMHGIKIHVNFGGSGYMLSQMKLAQKGDIFFPGSSDFMEIAKNDDLIYPETEEQVVYLVNAINVQNGNPKNIKKLKDLSQPGLKVAIANPEGVCVGAYAVEIIEQSFNEEQKAQFRKNIVTYTESCDKTATIIALKGVDAVIGWSVFQHWNPAQIESIALDREEIVRIGYIPIAITKFSKKKELAQEFIDFVTSEKGKEVFRKYQYFSSIDEAVDYIGTEKPVGGIYEVPATWLSK
ncbi:molybdate ABC transporter substrate-binding protein [Cytophagaceae bacterium ABcell3]|nr:molybdate ABC transporter substrate-binding protein [Cytophagaceae bacterium ABcell3]